MHQNWLLIFHFKIIRDEKLVIDEFVTIFVILRVQKIFVIFFFDKFKFFTDFLLIIHFFQKRMIANFIVWFVDFAIKCVIDINNFFNKFFHKRFEIRIFDRFAIDQFVMIKNALFDNLHNRSFIFMHIERQIIVKNLIITLTWNKIIASNSTYRFVDVQNLFFDFFITCLLFRHFDSSCKSFF